MGLGVAFAPVHGSPVLQNNNFFCDQGLGIRIEAKHTDSFDKKLRFFGRTVDTNCDLDNGEVKRTYTWYVDARY